MVLIDILPEEVRSDPSTVVLHAGIGNAVFDENYFRGTCLQFDFSLNGLKQIEPLSPHSLDLFVADAMAIPLRNSSIDLIIEKGLFDSVTGRSDIAVVRAQTLLCEYCRCLRPGGRVIVFSLFGPSSEEKDMLGLLHHPSLSVETRDLFIAPVEIPSQDFCFAYILTLT